MQARLSRSSTFLTVAVWCGPSLSTKGILMRLIHSARAVDVRDSVTSEASRNSWPAAATAAMLAAAAALGEVPEPRDRIALSAVVTGDSVHAHAENVDLHVPHP